MRELKPFELLVVLFVLWGVLFVFDTNSSTMVIVTALTGLLIVPHGAIDLALARELPWIKNSSVRLGIFFTIYLILAVSFWLIWPYFPNLCFAIFAVISLVHFGHNDTWKSSSKLVKWSSFLICSTLPWVQSGFWHEKETELIFTAMMPDEAGIASHFLRLGGYLWFIGVAFFAIFIVRRGNYRQKLMGIYHHKLMEIAVLVLTFATLRPELAFLVYTAAVHAPRHLRRTIPRAIAAHPSGKRGLTWEMAAILLITLGLAVWALVTNRSPDQDTALFQLIFIGLASLTLPHMLLIDLALFKNGRFLETITGQIQGVVQKQGILGNTPQVKSSQVLTSLRQQTYYHEILIFERVEISEIPTLLANVDVSLLSSIPWHFSPFIQVFGLS
ncbi:MAG: Brp/Blh family beta-carotene 15,15'-dioxygenase [Xenococcus sp. MO_188.B8]|nr:Brp/Blh family beta-carotene 15,15'-dioxygenase [Xenococcus sp. MO_188.B8]